MTNHTTGQWEAREPFPDTRDTLFSHCDVISGGKRVARVAGIGDEEAAANARLIASAPELLKALERLTNLLTDGQVVRECEDSETTPEEMAAYIYVATCLFNSRAAKKARAAISKAKGE